MSKQWPLNDAKTHLSAVIDQAKETPQLITKHGKVAAVVVSIETFNALSGVQNAWDAFRSTDPVLEDELFERLPASLRTVNFDE